MVSSVSEVSKNLCEKKMQITLLVSSKKSKESIMTLFGQSAIVLVLFSATLAIPHFGQVKTAKEILTTGSSEVAEKLPDPCELPYIFCPNKRYMRVTEYGWTGNRMSSGKYPYIGAVATSDRTIPVGSKIEIDGKEYTVEDRTAKWVHGLGDTIDIYSEHPRGLSHKVVYFK